MLVKFMFKSLSRSVVCMPMLNYDFQVTSLILNEQNRALPLKNGLFREKIVIKQCNKHCVGVKDPFVSYPHSIHKIKFS